MDNEVTEDAIIFQGVKVATIQWLERSSHSERDAAYLRLKEAVEQLPTDDEDY